jgi:hypothetical protein
VKAEIFTAALPKVLGLLDPEDERALWQFETLMFSVKTV